MHSNGSDESTHPRLTTFGLRQEAVFGDELVIEDHRLGYVAVSKAEDRSKIARSVWNIRQGAERR
jgi:hypothetical protein